MNNTILLSLNVFHPNEDLLRYGVYIARNLGATLVLFDAHYQSVLVPNEYVVPGASAIQVVDNDHNLEKAKKELGTIYNRLSEEWYYTRAKLVSDPIPSWQGNKEYYLLEEAERVEPLLIISEIQNDFGRLNELFGTVETKLADEANCPVLLLPGDYKYTEFGEINYLLERERPIDAVVQEVSFLKQLASNFEQKPTINLLYYFGMDTEAVEKELALKRSILQQELDYDRLEFVNRSQQDIETSIRRDTNEYRADLFAFPHRNHNFLERLTASDTTAKIVLQSNIPLVVF